MKTKNYLTCPILLFMSISLLNITSCKKDNAKPDPVVIVAPTLGNFPNITKTVGEPTFVLTPPTSNSSGAFTFTSSNTTVATISDRVVTIKAAGTSTITATQTATDTYLAASKNMTLTVNPATPTPVDPTITNFPNITKTVGDPTFVLVTPTSNSTGTFSYTSSNSAVATVSSTGTVTIISAGTSIIRATQTATVNYLSGYIECTLIVNPPIISNPTIVREAEPTQPTVDSMHITFIVNAHNSTGCTAYLEYNENGGTNSTTPEISFTGDIDTRITFKIVVKPYTNYGYRGAVVKKPEWNFYYYPEVTYLNKTTRDFVIGDTYKQGIIISNNSTTKIATMCATVDQTDVENGLVANTTWNGVNTQVINGFDNWRLATKNELLYIYDTPALVNLKNGFLHGTDNNDWYWTSTIYNSGINSYWIVNFNNRTTSADVNSGANPIYHIRVVRTFSY